MQKSYHHTGRITCLLTCCPGVRSAPTAVAGFVVFICFALLATPASAQKSSGYDVHANIIYHFTKYINWPDNKKTGDFVIGVVGESPIYWELKNSLVNKKADRQNIVVRQYSSSARVFDCHILFLGDEESYQVKRITAWTSGLPILLVSETDGLAQKGSCINFTIVSDRLKLEINKKNIEKRGLGIASELLQLGKLVK